MLPPHSRGTFVSAACVVACAASTKVRREQPGRRRSVGEWSVREWSVGEWSVREGSVGRASELRTDAEGRAHDGQRALRAQPERLHPFGIRDRSQLRLLLCAISGRGHE